MVPVLELALVDQAGVKLTEIHLPLPPEFLSAGIKGVCHRRLVIEDLKIGAKTILRFLFQLCCNFRSLLW